MKKILLSILMATVVFGMDTIPANQREFSESKFIPDISLIVDTTYVSRDISDDKITHLEMDGITHQLVSEGAMNAHNGFNLNYAELVLSSSVDPYFSLDGVFHFSVESVEIEEAYFTSTALDYGLRLKGGKFHSNFGYLNEQHHHSYDFNDRPLVYEAFLGADGINELGLQIQWTAPTQTYLMFGLEVLNGDNQQMFASASIDDAQISAKDGASLFVGYVKTSFDIGDTSILTGLSYAFDGDSKLYGFDLVAKHYFNSYSYLKFQGEALYRELDGTQINIASNKTTTSQQSLKKQAGAYAQVVYAPNKSWAGGLRYDTIFINDVTLDNTDTGKPKDLAKYSAMVEYSTSEFARFRLQYNQNEAFTNEAGNRVDVKTVMLSANISIGAHGAHSF